MSWREWYCLFTVFLKNLKNLYFNTFLLLSLTTLYKFLNLSIVYIFLGVPVGRLLQFCSHYIFNALLSQTGTLSSNHRPTDDGKVELCEVIQQAFTVLIMFILVLFIYFLLIYLFLVELSNTIIIIIRNHLDIICYYLKKFKCSYYLLIIYSSWTRQ